ncbi:hypothetical protein [Paenibacillus qinlingensis]|uniref:Uncharacterized protein n=1 Tax=Paenibacillus qinlingensis TaxID=1837343 RepID=A0ABU1NT50_9BACL|nr:hypothetical protein [Paenibacillus qinlingensis]MDR6550613.1 hypothetical protein [Paenibacillus qinlingensis]
MTLFSDLNIKHKLPFGILQSIKAESVHEEDLIWKISAKETHTIELCFGFGPSFVLQKTREWYILPMDEGGMDLEGDSYAWVLPQDPHSTDNSWLIRAEGTIRIIADPEQEIRVHVTSEHCELIPFECRPHADCFGNRYRFDFEQGEQLGKTLAAFYWGTMLPTVIEKTKAADYPESDGFVLSTLMKDVYAGTYPDVDHEFQIKGRMAWGNDLDTAVIRRMMELQFKLMREDPQELWRNPCAVQPDGTREYHVRRNSLDGKANANMFLITGNVEVVESAWLYVAVTKDREWLSRHIEDLEGAASGIEAYIDRKGRLWSDVYYEDQVMKDGRESLATALAANSFQLLSQLEQYLQREDKAECYAKIASRLSEVMVEPLPNGYWDPANRRFVDWIDRHGEVHDHIHLLANELPVMFSYATAEQEKAVMALMDAKRTAFQRFPSFVAAEIEHYTDTELGDGGPYDLCAAGRYWCWDAAFWSWKKDRDMLAGQLQRVSEQAAKESYIMGERYDMDYVYYVDGKDWHGAAHYYEYPCVFSWVFIHEYVGIRFSLEADLRIEPKLRSYGRVELQQSHFQIAYEYTSSGFSLTNLSESDRVFEVDLSALFPGNSCSLLSVAAGEAIFLPCVPKEG